jgi:hypothetical protein
MRAIDMKINCFRLFYFFLLVPPLLPAETNRWLSHDGGSEETGSAIKSFQCTVQKEGENVRLVMVSSWTPGATIEILGSASSADVKAVTTSEGSSAEQINFKFEDSFGNIGVGKLTSQLNKADLELTVTKPHTDFERARVTRQYRDLPILLSPST